jgi:hypothetical protein
MKKVLIDDFGAVHLTRSDLLLSKIGRCSDVDDAEHYAIENIGFIGVTDRFSTIHVRYRPDIVSNISIASLLYLLHDHVDCEIVISTFDGIWNSSRARNIAAATSLISYSVEKADRHVPDGGPRIICRASEAVSRFWASVAPTVVQYLPQGPVTGTLRDALNTTFRGRWMTLSVNLIDQSINCISLGEGYPPLHPMFSGTAQNFSFEKIEDSHFRRWLRETHLKSASQRKALFEDVDAIVDWPRFGEMRTRYWRLLVPYKKARCSIFLLTASGNDSTIDLRTKCVQVMDQVI